MTPSERKNKPAKWKQSKVSLEHSGKVDGITLPDPAAKTIRSLIAYKFMITGCKKSL